MGGAIARELRGSGHEPTIFSRRPTQGLSHREYDLSRPLPLATLQGFDCVIHCAYDLTLKRPDEIATVNIRGTRQLIAAAQHTGTRVVLISSMSAYEGTGQIYGRAKLQSERDTLDAGGEVVRLGLVWGGAQAGMFGTLRRLARLPLVPDFGRCSYQYLVHIDDVSAAVVRLIESEAFGEPVGLAHERRVPFRDLIRSLRDGEGPRFLRAPWRPTYAALRFAEVAKLPLPVRADSLLGLIAPAPCVPRVDYWTNFGIELRPYPL